MKKIAAIAALAALTLSVLGLQASAASGGFCRIQGEASVCQR